MMKENEENEAAKHFWEMLEVEGNTASSFMCWKLEKNLLFDLTNYKDELL